MATATHLLNLDCAALEQWLAQVGSPRFRARQVLEWVYERFVTSFDAMRNVPADLRRRLAGEFVIAASQVSRRAESQDGTIKLLLAWPDGATSECVLIPDDARRTACIGSQVGCPVQCVFCASGIGGMERNLAAGEIVEQAWRIAALCAEYGGRLSNIVLMGAGEPLANLSAVLAAVRTINADWGLGVGARRITISTVGLPSQIRKLAREHLQVNLALSLHAPNDELRRQIIPWAAKIPLSELLSACQYYFKETGREITLEYILLGGMNDLPRHAEELARFAAQLRCNVNLIRYNPVPGLPYERPTAQASQRFQDILRRHGVNTHLRRSRGLDIDAACGQLRRSAMADPLVSLNVAAPLTPSATATPT